MTNKSRCLASLLLPQLWILHPRMPMDKGHGARQAVVVVNHKSQICSGFKSSSRRSHKMSWDEPNIAHEISWSAGNPAAEKKKKTLQKAPFQPIPVTGWWFSNDEPNSSQAEKPWFVFMEQVGFNSTVQKGHKTYLIVGEQAHGLDQDSQELWWIKSFVHLGWIQKQFANCDPIHWNGFKQKR